MKHKFVQNLWMLHGKSFRKDYVLPILKQYEHSEKADEEDEKEDNMDIKNLPVGKNPPEEVNVFVEIPAGVSVKYELDKDSGFIFVDRFLFTEMNYPFNYGFIPNTLAGDGD